MSVLTRMKLSGTTAGKPLLITSTNSTGANTVHVCTTSTGSGVWDEVYLWGFNNTTGTVDLSLEYGDTTSVVVCSLSAKSTTKILPGTMGNASTTIKGFKGGAGTVGVIGFVNRIVSS